MIKQPARFQQSSKLESTDEFSEEELASSLLLSKLMSLSTSLSYFPYHSGDETPFLVLAFRNLQDY